MSDKEAPSRDRSASPARDSRPKKQKSTGFKWKEKRPRDDNNNESGATPKDSDRLHRGYRDRSPRPRDHDRNPERKGTDLSRSSHTRTDESIRTRDNDPLDRTTSSQRDRPRDEKPKKKKSSKTSAPPPASGPMIIVNVNDRLGTKAAIPCLASDSIKAFKAIVAAHIGRQPHEIMLKRQGERPFKDVLTLEDYGVSSGVQLDLEIDTGD
ncbi:hypothetical protein D0862_11909 [Hortaea werneckii]|uniref:Ubiquitin-like modifier HUB1 n=1 Tax=Hortaea werneckii TaxID=91943 RepID=A0A3M7F1K7_HORWE|nr:hypothetical protein D0862_11909 [Hortaea werneckii]